MNTGTIAVGAISLAICILPFVLLQLGKRKKEKLMLQSLFTLVGEPVPKISSHEVYSNLLLALDRENEVVYFMKQNGESASIQHESLRQIRSCRANVVHRTVPGSAGQQQVIQKVELRFAHKTAAKGETVFELYDEDGPSAFGSELELAQRWSDLVNSSLKAG